MQRLKIGPVAAVISVAVGATGIAGCTHSTPPTVTSAVPAATIPAVKATRPAAAANLAGVQHSLIGKWARSDGVIRTTFTRWGVYVMYVINTTPTDRGASSRPQSPVVPTTRGTYKIVDATHIQFTNHGRSVVNGITITGNQMTLANPDGTAQEWSRIQ